ncbi:MAG: hypothetical protein ABI222_10540 [Opitutaceae bacterium]
MEQADTIFIVSQNPCTNHLRKLTPLQKAKGNGGTDVAVNPMLETCFLSFKHPQDHLHPLQIPRFIFTPRTPHADVWLLVMIDGDTAFFQDLMKQMLEEEDRRPGQIFDDDFVRHHTPGIEALTAQRRETSWEQIVDSALIRMQIHEAPAHIRQMPKGKTLRLVLPADAAINWTADGWATINHADAVEIGALKLWFADLPTGKCADDTGIEFTFFWKQAQRWEGTHCSVVIGPSK